MDIKWSWEYEIMANKSFEKLEVTIYLLDVQYFFFFFNNLVIVTL